MCGFAGSLFVYLHRRYVMFMRSNKMLKNFLKKKCVTSCPLWCILVVKCEDNSFVDCKAILFPLFFLFYVLSDSVLILFFFFSYFQAPLISNLCDHSNLHHDLSTVFRSVHGCNNTRKSTGKEQVYFFVWYCRCIWFVEGIRVCLPVRSCIRRCGSSWYILNL